MVEVVRAHADLDGNAFLRADPSFHPRDFAVNSGQVRFPNSLQSEEVRGT